jgi:Flavinator of succinate dehydrogenase
MTPAELVQYDNFLDENDWDIYYWATQLEPSTSVEYAEGGAGASEKGTQTQASLSAQGKAMEGNNPAEGAHEGGVGQTAEWRKGQAASGEWAQTIGAFKPAFRPVPMRWKKSDVLRMLRQHVVDRSAGGVGDGLPGVEGKALGQSAKGAGVGGINRMPDVRSF